MLVIWQEGMRWFLHAWTLDPELGSNPSRAKQWLCRMLPLSLTQAWDECLPLDPSGLEEECRRRLGPAPEGCAHAGSCYSLFPGLGEPLIWHPPWASQWLQARAEPGKGISKVASKGQVGVGSEDQNAHFT